MARWSKVYRGIFRNIEVDPSNNTSLGVDVQVDIYDTTSAVADDPTEIIDLEMADNPISIEVVDNDEDKFSTVFRSKRAIVNIHSSDTIGIETFIDGGDHRFYADVILPGHLKLTGFLSVADVEEDFQPDPNIISLVITDGLGFTEDKELVDFDGNTPSGVHPIGLIVAWALAAGAGYRNSMRIAFNIRDEEASTLAGDIAAPTADGHFFLFNYLDLRTFEGSNPGTRLTCAEVLRRILFGCEISQDGGQWLIKRIDELQSDANLYLCTFDENADFSSWSTVAPSSLIKQIGDGLSLSWMNDDARVSADRALRRLELKRSYEYFKEIPCNVDFERGTGTDPTGAADETIDYVLECWRFLREGVSPVDLDTAPFAGSTGVLRKRFEYNYEKERYLVNGVAGGFRHYFKSEGIRMAEKSKITIGFQWRSQTDTAGVTANVAHMRLVGDDGNIYDWNLTTGGVSSWSSAKTVSSTVFDTTWQDSISGIDDAEWQSISATSQPAPVSGTLYIRLMNDLATPMRHFTALTVSYDPLINNSYAKYTGEQDSVEQTGDNIALRQDDLYIGSGPDMNVKGAILRRAADIELYSGTANFGTFHDIQMTGDKRNIFQEGQKIVITGSTSGNNIIVNVVSVSYSVIGDTTTIITDGDFTLEVGATVVIYLVNFELSNQFYSAAVFPSGTPDPSYNHPYGQIVAFDIWNQYNRVMRRFEGTVDGLNTNLNPIDLFYLYSLTDGNPNTVNRVFILLHFSQDLHLCEMNDAMLIEIYSTDNYKQYSGHAFKFLTE